MKPLPAPKALDAFFLEARCKILDLAAILDRIDRGPDAAAIRWEQCQVYGALQQASAAGKRAALPALLERLAEYEERLIAALG